jgi:two-component system phosphate regulon sensor histidine kinase PhoR
MKNRNINVIIFAGILSILLVSIVQYVWADNLVNVERKQFNHKVKIALTNAGYKLRLIHHTSIDKIHLVKQISKESFIVEIQDIVNPSLIDSLLQEEFGGLEVNRDYKIAIYDCFTDSVLYSHSGSKQEEQVTAKEYGVNWDINSYNFGVIFSKENIFLTYRKIWIGSVGVLLLLSFFFSYTIILIIRQKKLSDMKTDFINNMTHELKTPISTISLSSKVINNPDIINQPERLSRYASIIEEENLRLKNQVERVLQISFFERQDIQLNIGLSNVKKLVEASIKPFEIILEEKEGIINLIGEPFDAELDENYFSNVLSNLIDNAIKYAGEIAPEINVSIEKNEKRFTLKVSDNGIGMKQEELKNIFNKFYRVPTGNVHNVKGFGIGLSYVQLMVKKHGGSIKVDSQIGQGSQFTIVLPLKQKA